MGITVMQDKPERPINRAFVAQRAVCNAGRRAARLALHPRAPTGLLLRPSKVGNARMRNDRVAFATSTLVVPHTVTAPCVWFRAERPNGETLFVPL